MDTMKRSDLLERIVQSSRQVQTLCRSDDGCKDPPSFSGTGHLPQLSLPTWDWIHCLATETGLVANVVSTALQLLDAYVRRLQDITILQYSSVIKNICSLQQIGGPDDDFTERAIANIFEETYRRYICNMEEEVARQLKAASDPGHDLSRSGHSEHAIDILNHAFSLTPVLTTAECTFLAHQAGITHQQVRTWFQNRRNRKNKSEKRYVSDTPTRPATTQDSRRVISSLPKRAKQNENLTPPPPPRSIRRLPKRHVPVHSYSYSTSSDTSSSDGSPSHEERRPEGRREPSPAPSLSRSISAGSDYSSSSSLDSINPSGGFMSPLDLHLTKDQIVARNTIQLNLSQMYLAPQHTYSTQIEQQPLFNFTPPTPLNAKFGFNMTTSPTGITFTEPHLFNSPSPSHIGEREGEDGESEQQGEERRNDLWELEKLFDVEGLLPAWGDDDFADILSALRTPPPLPLTQTQTTASTSLPTSNDTQNDLFDMSSQETVTGESGMEGLEVMGEDEILSSLSSLFSTSPDEEGLTVSFIPAASGRSSPLSASSSNSSTSTAHSRNSSDSFFTNSYEDSSFSSTSTSSINLMDKTNPSEGTTVSSPSEVLLGDRGMEDTSSWTSGVLAFDINPVEWKGMETNFAEGGVWDFGFDFDAMEGVLQDPSCEYGIEAGREGGDGMVGKEGMMLLGEIEGSEGMQGLEGIMS